MFSVSLSLYQSQTRSKHAERNDFTKRKKMQCGPREKFSKRGDNSGKCEEQHRSASHPILRLWHVMHEPVGDECKGESDETDRTAKHDSQGHQSALLIPDRGGTTVSTAAIAASLHLRLARRESMNMASVQGFHLRNEFQIRSVPFRWLPHQQLHHPMLAMLFPPATTSASSSIVSTGWCNKECCLFASCKLGFNALTSSPPQLSLLY